MLNVLEIYNYTTNHFHNPTTKYNILHFLIIISLVFIMSCWDHSTCSTEAPMLCKCIKMSIKDMKCEWRPSLSALNPDVPSFQQVCLVDLTRFHKVLFSLLCSDANSGNLEVMGFELVTVWCLVQDHNFLTITTPLYTNLFTQ